MTTPVPGPRPHDEPSEEHSRRLPRTFGGFVFLLVVVMTLVGLGIVAIGPWRTGLSWMGTAMLVGALARALLTERGAGMLRVRRRWSDVLTLVVGGVALLVLAVVVPDQPVA